MSTAQHPERPKPKFGIRWWITGLVTAGVAGVFWNAAYGTGNWVLVAAMWAALLTFATVSYSSFAKRERRRRANESEAVAEV